MLAAVVSPIRGIACTYKIQIFEKFGIVFIFWVYKAVTHSLAVGRHSSA
jgi:hypothetical protein